MDDLSRRSILKIAGLASTCLSGFLYAQQKTTDAKPNVLFIAIDDLNDWVGCLGGHPNAKTPNIDALAKKGMLFTNAHCQAPICGPSRASLMSGLLPTTTGIYGQIGDKNLRKSSEPVKQATFLPEYFKQQGYKTIGVGKLFHNGGGAGAFEQYGGFASFGPKPKKRFKYDPKWFKDKFGGTQTDWGPYPAADEKMPDYKISNWAVEKLKEKHDKPFFLAAGFMRPHVPWYVPQKWFDMHPVENIKTPPYRKDDLADVSELSRRVNEVPCMPTTEWAIETKQWKDIVQSYLASTTFVDHYAGQVIDALKASKYADNDHCFMERPRLPCRRKKSVFQTDHLGALLKSSDDFFRYRHSAK